MIFDARPFGNYKFVKSNKTEQNTRHKLFFHSVTRKGDQLCDCLPDSQTRDPMGHPNTKIQYSSSVLKLKRKFSILSLLRFQALKVWRAR